jgi:Putative restriction endonuclease
LSTVPDSIVGSNKLNSLRFICHSYSRQHSVYLLLVINRTVLEPGGRDNYKIWEEGQVPSVIFEMTLPGTQSKDDIEKKNLYENLGVTEYWQFDPRGEWIPEKLRGYRLQGEIDPAYVLIANNQSEPLQLQLMVEDKIIAFYRLDNGVRLLPIEELNVSLAKEIQRANELESQLKMYQQQFGKLPPTS